MAARPREGRLTGRYSIGPATLVDPPPGEPPATHLRVELDGRSAADLYQALPGRPTRDACRDDGTLVKSSGALSCWREPGGRHGCSFGIDLPRGRLAAGMAC